MMLRHRLVGVWTGLIVIAAGLLTGCGAGGRLAVRSVGDTDIAIKSAYDIGYYAFDNDNELSVLLIEGEPDNPSQALHLRMLWEPRAGRTPMDIHGINASVRYVVFAGDEVGVYDGAGFMTTSSWSLGRTLRAAVRDATLRLTDRSRNFEDRLGLATASGGFSVERNDAVMQKTLRRLERVIHQRLGYPRMVDATSAR